MMTGASDTQISTIDFQTPQASGLNHNLWSYHKNGTINGVPVNQSDKGLNITSQSQLSNAFQLAQDIQVWSGWLAPQYPQQLKQYQEIKQREAQNKCIILDQKLQFSSTKDAYLALLTYANIQFVLDNRYDFYKQDLINERLN